MRRCYLHIGTPKTGSTTVQQFLRHRGPSLLQFGYFVPSTGSGPGGNHFLFAKAVSGHQIPLRHVNCVQGILHEISEHPGMDIVLSSESMELLFRRHPVDNPVISLLRRNGFDVVLVGYYRNQPQRISSGYAQLVKTLSTSISFDERVRQICASGRLDYTFWNAFATRNGCELLARPYNTTVRTAGIVEDFLSTIGIGNLGIALDVQAQTNRSPGPCALAAVIEVLRRAEECGHQWTHRQRVRAKRLLADLAEEPQLAEKPFCGFDTKAAREIQASYRPSNDRFAEAVWGEDWATVFREDVDAQFERNVFETETASPEAKQRYAEILKRLWSGVQDIMKDPHLRKEPERVPAEFG